MPVDCGSRRFAIRSRREEEEWRGPQSRPVREEGGASSTVLPPPEPLSARATFLPAGGRPGSTGLLTGAWMTRGSRRIPLTKPSTHPSPSSSSVCETEAFPWEPFLGLGQALVCNLNVASLWRNLCSEKLWAGLTLPSSRPQPGEETDLIGLSPANCSN